MEPRTTYASPHSTSLPRQRSTSIPAQRSRPAPVPAPLDGLGQVTALARDGLTGLPRTLHSPRRTALWVLWLTGILGDAATSLLMIRTGLFEEGNPLAALGMGSVGMTGYVLLSSVLCLPLAAVSTGTPRGPVARVAVAFLLLVAAGKVVMVFSNILLWRSATGV